MQKLLAERGASDLESVPVVVARVREVDGKPVAELVDEVGGGGGRRWALTREQRLTYMEKLPEGNRIVAGELWIDPARHELSVDQEFANDLGVHLGSIVDFDVQGVPMTLRRHQPARGRLGELRPQLLHRGRARRARGRAAGAHRDREAPARRRAAHPGPGGGGLPQRHRGDGARRARSDRQAAAPTELGHLVPRRVHAGGGAGDPRRHRRRRVEPARPRGRAAEDARHAPRRSRRAVRHRVRAARPDRRH